MKPERNLVLAAVVAGICLLPIIVFLLLALWPQRVLVSWLVLGFVALVILVNLALRVIKVRTTAKVRLSEEELRTGRLYANERLIETEERYNDEWTAQPQQVMRERPYVYSPHHQAPNPHDTDTVPYSGLHPLSIESYDWEEKE